MGEAQQEESEDRQNDQTIDRHVTRTKIVEGARTLLTFLDENNIVEPSQLLMLGRTVSQQGKGVVVKYAPSNGGVNAHKISYVECPYGIPIDVTINTILIYTQVIMKGTFEPPEEYLPFAEDLFGNTIYSKIVRKADIPTVTSLLEELANE